MSSMVRPEPTAQADRVRVARSGRAWRRSILRHRRAMGRQPTWAEALAGVDPQLLTPIMTVPEEWPLPAAVWRRELRGRLMSRLRLARWVSYSTAPRSLRVGARGRAWLTGRVGAPV